MRSQDINNVGGRGIPSYPSAKHSDVKTKIKKKKIRHKNRKFMEEKQVNKKTLKQSTEHSQVHVCLEECKDKLRYKKKLSFFLVNGIK